jgi:hypothetical protein
MMFPGISSFLPQSRKVMGEIISASRLKSFLGGYLKTGVRVATIIKKYINAN